MPKPRREDVDVTALIRNILDNYPAGSATVREFLQNTDDCGARKQIFYLDTRIFSSDALVDPALASCQGPAILAVNDGYFLERDWKAITQIHNSSKTSDETSTGKYGLGFRSCYHITDNPQILSGDTLLVLDPHQRVEDYPGGLSLSTTGTDREKYGGHFDAFNAVLPQGAERYEGTAIRLPLRLDASESRIKSTPTSVEAARQMFRDFITRDLAESMLFLKNITNVELIEIAQDGGQTTVGRAWIDNPDVAFQQRSRNRGREQETSHHKLTVHVDVAGVVDTRHWAITHFVEEYRVAQQHMAKRLGRSVADSMATDKLLPHVALALPIPDREHEPVTTTFQGRLFTLLPLPIFTGFPLHVNAVLALTSSRQNLRNAPDAVSGSREEFLVEWNRVIFSELVPKAWAAMFQYIVALPRAFDIFDAWPQNPTSSEGDREYWHTLPTRLLEEAGAMSVWPIRTGSAAAPSYFPLKAVLLASGAGSTPTALLGACGVPIASPPVSVYTLVQQSSTYQSRILSPAAAHKYLKQNVPAFSGLNKAAVRTICDYLASSSPRNMPLLLGLPLFINAKGDYTSLVSTSKYTLATEAEASLFQTADPGLIMIDQISPTTCSLLLEESAERIHRIRPQDVTCYLQQLFSRFMLNAATISHGVKDDDATWLVQFWNWANQWDESPSLFSQKRLYNTIKSLYLIPLSTPAGQAKLRRCMRAALNPSGIDYGVLAALRSLEVPILHPSVSIGRASRGIIAPSPDLVFVLDNIPSHTSFENLDQETRKTLHEYFSESLSHFHRQRHSLSAVQQATLRNLPIFPVLPPGLRRRNAAPIFDVAPSSSVFVDESVEVVPHVRGKPFIDGTEGGTLARALGETSVKEVSVLDIAIRDQNWTQQQQVSGLVEALVDRIIRRLNDLDQAMRDRVSQLPIVDVGAGRAPIKPSSVVDPKSSIAILFDISEGALPSGRFADDGAGSYIQQLRSFGMLRSSLTDFTIPEIVTKLGDHSKPFAGKEEKALHLLRLLDEYAGSNALSDSVITSLRNQAWLPAQGRCYLPSECWDSRKSDMELCDYVLPLVAKVVRSHRLREALGWVTLSFDKLKAQFLAVVRERSAFPSQSKPKTTAERVVPLLRELSHRYHDHQIECSDANLRVLVDALGDNPWVPVKLDICKQPQQTVLDRIELGLRFHQVHPPLLEHVGMRELLSVMGIPTRPTPLSLLAELQLISDELTQAHEDGKPQEDLIDASISIVTEFSHHPPEAGLAQLLVPTDKQELKPINNIIYNDRGFHTSEISSGSFFAHPSVSPALALALGLRQLSEEEFDRDEDDIETFHMEEDLSNRIKNVIKSYDIEYASNEWVANADDANASTVKLLLDERCFKGTWPLLKPELEEFQDAPALVIFNDSEFSEKDFEGLRKVGEGGKGDTPETIGRFGLGALSFYHFSEMPAVVSAGSVLFLDPSASYLPRKGGVVKRTGIKMSLDLCQMRYPGQLMPLHGLFGFERSTSHYKGTLFRLPLRTASQASKSKLSNKSYSVLDLSKILDGYFRSSTQSLFFSKLQDISALRRGPDGTPSTLWSVVGSRPSTGEAWQASNGTSSRLTLEISEDGRQTREERWLICTSRAQKDDFLEDLRPLFTSHRLPPPTIAIALNISSEGSASRDLNSRLFATLPLPISTSLPVHVHATWMLSDDRRALRFDLPDARGHRPLDTRYNEFILEKLVPPLYLRALATVASSHPREMEHCWPKPPTDPISELVATALYSQLATTTELVLRTVTNETIAPKNALIHFEGVSAVRRLLAELQIPEFVGVLPFGPLLVKSWAGLETDNPTKVAELLQIHAKDVKKIYADPSKADADIDSLLRYLLKGKVSLTDIPLLQLEDGRITTFQAATKPKVFATCRRTISSLFGRNKVIGRAASLRTVDLILEQRVNLRKLDVPGLCELLELSNERIVPAARSTVSSDSQDWYRDLLRFIAGPECPVRLEDIANYPIIPTRDGGHAISLNCALAEGVWWASPQEDQSITPVLQHLQVPIIDFPIINTLRTHQVDLPGVLKILRPYGDDLRTIHQGDMPIASWADFVDWMKRTLAYYSVTNLDAVGIQTLSLLPLFPGQRGLLALPFTSASEVLMLPAQVTSRSIARYLPGDTMFASYSSSLQAVLERLGSSRNLSLQNVFGQLNLPDTLPQADDDDFSLVLTLIGNHHREHFRKPLIPDENRVIRAPDQLYDETVPLFRSSFHNRPTHFVHPNFRQLMDLLIPLGVHREISTAELVACAEAVDHDTREGLDTQGRAELLWASVNAIDVRTLQFDSIADLRFIPSNGPRHLHEPEFAHFAKRLPSVVSPREICLVEHASVLWTQRAIFAVAPSPVTRAIFPGLGVPTAGEVVEHLVTLATVVAPAHPGNRLLLSDLLRTYQWIHLHVEEVQPFLLQKRGQRIWLNVDDPMTDPWVWRSAAELVFDLRYDQAGKFYDVNEYLAAYRALLLAVGAKEYHYATLDKTKDGSNSASSHAEQVLTGWQNLRKRDVMYDIQFEVDGEVIKAHRGMLAAVVPHFSTVFTAGFRESQSFSIASDTDDDLAVYELHVDTSAFAVRSVVDYVYTGKFFAPSSETTEEATLALAALLELMELASFWQMDGLKLQAVETMVTLQLVRAETCDHILERAEACKVPELAEICRVNKANNQWD